MTQVQQMRMGLRVAQTSLERAMSSTDADEMAALAIQAANRILESSSLRPVEVQRSRCPNPVCNRIITEADPIFAGFCSTMCREGFSRRGTFNSIVETVGRIYGES